MSKFQYGDVVQFDPGMGMEGTENFRVMVIADRPGWDTFYGYVLVGCERAREYEWYAQGWVHDWLRNAFERSHA